MRRKSVFISDSSSMDLNMTPMIDVIFQLLIFFLCTSNFMAPEYLLATNLSLPGTGVDANVVPPDLLDLEEVVIQIHVQPQLSWEIASSNYQTLPEVAAVVRALAAQKSDLPVIIDIDGDVPLGKVIDLYDLCRQAGLSRVQFAAEMDPETSP